MAGERDERGQRSSLPSYGSSASGGCEAAALLLEVKLPRTGPLPPGRLPGAFLWPVRKPPVRNNAGL